MPGLEFVHPQCEHVRRTTRIGLVKRHFFSLLRVLTGLVKRHFSSLLRVLTRENWYHRVGRLTAKLPRYRDPKTFGSCICPATDSPLYRTRGALASAGRLGRMPEGNWPARPFSLGGVSLVQGFEGKPKGKPKPILGGLEKDAPR